MKKVIMSLALLLTAVISANAQILRAEELEKYAREKYGDKRVEAATNLGKQLTLAECPVGLFDIFSHCLPLIPVETYSGACGREDGRHCPILLAYAEDWSP